MTQDEKWQLNYQAVIDFIGTIHRNPSKHRTEELNMLSWCIQQSKFINTGKMKSECIEMFNKLQELDENTRE